MSKTTVHLEELPYQADSCVLFERIRELPRALMLDSGHPHTLAGRFDILTADPCYSFDFSGSNTMTYEGIRELFLNIARVHSEHCGGLVTPSEDIPFCGGIAGALDYGLGKALQSIPAEPGAGGSLHFYSWAVVQDHLLRRCTFASLPTLDMAARLNKRGHVFAPHRGFYAMTPARYLKWGASLPRQHADAMMNSARNPSFGST